jgi:hypothetical protein
MDGAIVQLNASEEITLRQVHCGIAKAYDMIARDVDRLTAAGLVVQQDHWILLTDAGRKRLRSLPAHDDPLDRLLKLLVGIERFAAP